MQQQYKRGKMLRYQVSNEINFSVEMNNKGKYIYHSSICENLSLEQIGEGFDVNLKDHMQKSDI